MKPLIVLVLTLLSVAVDAAPVHIALKPSSAVQPGSDDFFVLGSIADLSGGASALRIRLALVSVGRVPLPGDVRHLTRGDLALKLRQAGFHPGRDAVLEGAADADVTAAGSGLAGVPRAAPSSPALSPPHSGGPPPVLIHRADPVTIRIDDGELSITAQGVARDNGAAGDLIHVHREGCLTDLTVTVLDAQTVQLEP